MKNRKTLGIAFLVVAVLAAIWTSGVVLAQRGPGGPGPQAGPGGPGGMMPPPVMQIGMVKAGDSGVFILAGPTLVKYSADLTHQDTVQLVEPPADTDVAPKPPLHGAMLLVPADGDAAEKVLVVIGDKFFAVDADTLAIAATGTLPAIDLPAGAKTTTGNTQKQKPLGPPPGPGGLEYNDGTLYIQRGPAVIALNAEDGSVIGQATLPKPDAE